MEIQCNAMSGWLSEEDENVVLYKCCKIITCNNTTTCLWSILQTFSGISTINMDMLKQ